MAIVVGLTALIAGTLLALDRAGVPSVGATGGIWAIAAIALGLGIVIAGLRGRTAGILTLFAIVAVFTAIELGHDYATYGQLMLDPVWQIVLALNLALYIGHRACSKALHTPHTGKPL